MTTAILIFIAATIVHTVIKYRDIASSIEFTKYGIKEKNWLFSNADGTFSPFKAWIGVGVVTALAVAVFIGFTYTDYSPAFASLVYIPSAGMSLLHTDKNNRIIAKYKARASSGGIL